jgi:hypothetical protein
LAQVHAKVVDETLCITKAIFKVRTSPEEIFELLIDESRLSEIIPNLRQLTVLEKTVGSISNPVKCLGNLTFDSSFDKVIHLPFIAVITMLLERPFFFEANF